MQPRRGHHKPAPFKRDSFAIEHHNRSWQNVTPDKITPGETIAGFGRVDEIISDDDEYGAWTLVNGSGEEKYVNPGETVFAFTEWHDG